MMLALLLALPAFAVSTQPAGRGGFEPLPVGRSYSSPPPAPPPGSCHLRGPLPDPHCTPGAINPAVSASDITTTICRRGWTTTVRPPESYTERLKVRQMLSYGETGARWHYEEDHLVPLELGGAPNDPRNLWPEPGAAPNPKDYVEDAARAAVCEGRMELAVARRAIATNWVTLGRTLGVPVPATSARDSTSTKPSRNPTGPWRNATPESGRGRRPDNEAIRPVCVPPRSPGRPRAALRPEGTCPRQCPRS